MNSKISKLEASRRKGENQVVDQRANILDAAEKLFLENGIEFTTMTEIAAEAGINRVSLYRYFSDRHTLAFEIAVRMLKRSFQSIAVEEGLPDLEIIRRSMNQAIGQFHEARDVYRYLGMFDNQYSASYPNQALADWYKAEIFGLSSGWGMKISPERTDDFPLEPVAMIGNCVMSYLQKMAMRGNLLAAEQGINLDEQLNLFKDMINVYFDRLEQDADRFSS